MKLFCYTHKENQNGFTTYQTPRTFNSIISRLQNRISKYGYNVLVTKVKDDDFIVTLDGPNTRTYHVLDVSWWLDIRA